MSVPWNRLNRLALHLLEAGTTLIWPLSDLAKIWFYYQKCVCVVQELSDSPRSCLVVCLTWDLWPPWIACFFLWFCLQSLQDFDVWIVIAVLLWHHRCYICASIIKDPQLPLHMVTHTRTYTHAYAQYGTWIWLLKMGVIILCTSLCGTESNPCLQNQGTKGYA